MRRSKERERGMAMILMVVLGAALIVVSVTSIESSVARSTAQRVQRDAFIAKQIAESAAAQALARMKEGGFLAPMSGGGTSAVWVGFSGGSYYYSTVYNATTEMSTIRAWGRVPVGDLQSTSVVAPDDVAWNGAGWFTKGIEVSVQGLVFIPETPVFFGNGGVERPMGGFAWTGSSDPNDPSTWGTVTSGPSSWQSSSVPFESSSLDHPADYLYNGGTPTAASTNPHPYNIWASQNGFGQANIEAWFENSAGTSSDPTTKLTPPPTSSYYDMSDPSSPDYAFPIDPSIPDVQDFSYALWNKYGASTASTVTKLAGGSRSGTYGDMANPGVTFVTGGLTVPSGQTFQGAGILVIRDNYDPNAGGSNTPSTASNLTINGTFKWTGLVIVAGWAPTISVSSTGDATVVGAFFGEDSVMSGGEISLDSATIVLQVNGPFKTLYSNSLFQPGGMVRNFMPTVSREVVGIRDI